MPCELAWLNKFRKSFVTDGGSLQLKINLIIAPLTLIVALISIVNYRGDKVNVIETSNIVNICGKFESIDQEDLVVW